MDNIGIESTPGVAGGAACIAQTRIPVWLLVQARQLGSSDAEILRSFPALTAEDLANAWAYYRANPESIEKEIATNEEIDEIVINQAEDDDAWEPPIFVNINTENTRTNLARRKNWP